MENQNNSTALFSQMEWEQMKSDNVILKEQIQLLLKELGNLKQPTINSSNKKSSFGNISQDKSIKDNYSEIIEENGEEKVHE